MNKPQALNFLLFSGSESRELGSVETPPLLRLLRPASFGLWFIIFVAQAISFVATGEGVSIFIVLFATLLFVGVHIQFWYEESERGRRVHHSIERFRGRIYEDEDTGLPNSRHFVFELRRQMMRSVRNGKSFSLVLIELVGADGMRDSDERLLANVGRNVRQALGDGDFVARLQGAVFGAIVLDDRDGLTAAQKSDSFQSAAAAAIPLEKIENCRPVISVSGYEGELEVRDFLRRAQRDLQTARERATGPLYQDPSRVLGSVA